MRFAKAQEKKMGMPEQPVKKREPQKSPISKIWISTSLPIMPVYKLVEGGKRVKDIPET
jgi:hypothetical protein